MRRKERSAAYSSHRRKPEWLRIPVRSGGNLKELKDLLRGLHLHTVCEEANCPNRMECFSSRTATFMILGSICTRDCRFCNVSGGEAEPVDPEEPQRLAEAVRRLALSHVVITSVTRDDLPDGGASHFARTVEAVKRLRSDGLPHLRIELLIPDFLGDADALAKVTESGPDIINHNMETVPRLYEAVRPQADYGRSLRLLRRVKEQAPSIYTKSGIMLGLGERDEEIDAVMDDLRKEDCDFLTIGQYLSPSSLHHPVVEYIHPDRFTEYAQRARRKGFSFVASAPFVRSSYHAAEALL